MHRIIEINVDKVLSDVSTCQKFVHDLIHFLEDFRAGPESENDFGINLINKSKNHNCLFVVNKPYDLQLNPNQKFLTNDDNNKIDDVSST